MQNKTLIITTTAPAYKFPENFSCWCAGALEAQKYHTILNIIPLEDYRKSPPIDLNIQEENLKELAHLLLTTENGIFIFPEYNNLLPSCLSPFIELLAKGRYKMCKLITIVLDPLIHPPHVTPYDLYFGYPLHQLDGLFGSSLREQRTQIKDSPTGDMCYLFAEHYEDLCALIQQIITA